MAESSESSSKRLKAEDKAEKIDVDRISNLPDSVLLYILSFLSTKSCFAMSILSSRWRHLMKQLQVLEFVDDSFLTDSVPLETYHQTLKFKRFAIFVYGVLALRRERDIRKFKLVSTHSSDPFHDDSVAMWVRAAIGPHLEEMELQLFSVEGFFTLPTTLFTCCSSMVSLTLSGRITVECPSNVRLPLLKFLRLDLHYVDSLDTLLSGFPVLESLELSVGETNSTEIRMPSTLKMLTIKEFRNRICDEVEIDAPSLEYLSITQRYTCFHFSNGNLQNVLEAYVDLFATDNNIDCVNKLLRAISGVKFMVLCGLRPKCLLLPAPIIDFPEFHCLVHLELPWFGSNYLVKVLQKCPMLEDLVIHGGRKEPWLLPHWTQPTSDPNCLVYHLTSITFICYQGYADELDFSGYILQRGLVLETMTIDACILEDLEKKHEIVRELSAIPRGSSICQLTFESFD